MQAPSEPVAEQIGYLLKRAQLAVRGALEEALAAHAVTMAQYATLAALEEEPGLSNADLARRAFVKPQTMTQVLAGLERAGLVTRTPHPQHGRIRQARLTPRGQDLVGRCHALSHQVHERMLAGFDTPDRNRLREALRHCAQALGA